MTQTITRPTTTTTTRVTKRKADDDDDNDDGGDLQPQPKRSMRQLKIGESKAAALAADAANEAAVGRWLKLHGCLVLTHPECKHSDRIVAFDMDDTLIRTKSGRKFAQSSEDWQYFSDNVVPKCKKLVEEGCKLVIFTNQGGIDGTRGYDSNKEKVITKKIEDILASSGLPFQVFVATSDDVYRKPSPAMWQLMAKSHNGGVAPNLAMCAFVGDAAGRAAGHRPGAPKDHACSDRKFALNAGLQFATPDAFFDGLPEAPFVLDGFDVASLAEAGDADVCDGGVASLVASSQELVLLVGWPGCGKSTFARTHLAPKGYVWVNRDTLKTKEKCLKVAIEALDSGKSCVVDNTNPDAATRATYINAARTRGVPVRCFRMTAPRELAEYLNRFREQVTNGAQKHVPRIAYNVYNKNFQEPSLNEGFAEIKKINFVVRHETERARELFQFFK